MVHFQDALPLVLFAVAILIFYRWILRDMERDQQAETDSQDVPPPALGESVVSRSQIIISPQIDELDLLEIRGKEDMAHELSHLLISPVSTCTCFHCSLTRVYGTSWRADPSGVEREQNGENVSVRRRA